MQPPVPGLPVQPGGFYQYGSQNVLQVDMPGPSRLPRLEEDDDPYGGVRESVDFAPQRGYGQDERIGRREQREPDPVEEWNFEELGKEGVDAGAFLTKQLMGADSDERKRFEAALQNYRAGTAKELQTNVFKK